jgi:hypothetical protein
MRELTVVGQSCQSTSISRGPCPANLKQSAQKGPKGTSNGSIYGLLKRQQTWCQIVPTPNTSQKKKLSSTERKMHLSNVVLFLVSVFAFVLAAPLHVSMHSSAITHI